MVERPYKCPLCHSAFRNESGMKWHLAHRHEVPRAFDALNENYESKIKALQEEKTLLGQEVEQFKTERDNTKIALSQEQMKNAEATANITKLNRQLDKALLALATRDVFIKRELDIDMPEPSE